MEPKVAVIVPVYNMERYLRECLDSLVGQTFKDIEIICFNDASTDSSIDILREYAARDERFIIIDSPVNIKQGGGRNAGIRAARAPYIMFVDPDDWVEPDFVEKYYTKAVETGADIVTGDYNTVTEGKVEPVCNLGKNLPDDTEFIKRLRLEIDVPIWANLYKRCLFFKHNLFFPENIQLGEDSVIAAPSFLAADKIIKIDYYLYNYRILPKTSSHGIDLNLFRLRYPTAIMTWENLKRIDKDKKYTKEINRLFIRYYYTMPFYWGLGLEKIPYEDFRKSVVNIYKFLTKKEINIYLSNQTRSVRLCFAVLPYSIRGAVFLQKSITAINKILRR